MPFIAVLGADTGQIGSGALAAPLERVVIDRLAGHRIVTIAQGFCPERTNHLRVTVVATFTGKDVTACQLQCRVGLHALDRFGGGLLEEQRNDFHQSAKQQDEQNQSDHQEVVSLNGFVRHAGRFI